VKVGVGGRVGPVRGGVSNRGVGVGVGPGSVGHARRGRRSSGSSIGFVGFLAFLAGVALILSWPYLLGTFVAVKLGAGTHSTARNLVGWGFEVPYLVCILLALVGILVQKRK
jgi:hypothetical protein